MCVLCIVTLYNDRCTSSHSTLALWRPHGFTVGQMLEEAGFFHVLILMKMVIRPGLVGLNLPLLPTQKVGLVLICVLAKWRCNRSLETICNATIPHLIISLVISLWKSIFKSVEKKILVCFETGFISVCFQGIASSSWLSHMTRWYFFSIHNALLLWGRTYSRTIRSNFLCSRCCNNTSLERERKGNC